MNQERLLKVILSPHVSEKAAIGMEKRNTYVFHVADFATKGEIMDAVELMFNAKVKDVRVVNVHEKEKMFRGRKGQRKGWKKAYITLQSDQKIDLVSA
jgi:large subunit ribosomal protein L23